MMGAHVSLGTVVRQGITGLNRADIAAATEAGERWKLIGHIKRQADGAVSVSVQPMRLPIQHPLAGVSGVTNAITFTTDLLGDVTLVGPGAGRYETGFAVLSDLLEIAHVGKP